MLCRYRCTERLHILRSSSHGRRARVRGRTRRRASARARANPPPRHASMAREGLTPAPAALGCAKTTHFYPHSKILRWRPSPLVRPAAGPLRGAPRPEWARASESPRQSTRSRSTASTNSAERWQLILSSMPRRISHTRQDARRCSPRNRPVSARRRARWRRPDEPSERRVLP